MSNLVVPSDQRYILNTVSNIALVFLEELNNVPRIEGGNGNRIIPYDPSPPFLDPGEAEIDSIVVGLLLTSLSVYVVSSQSEFTRIAYAIGRAVERQGSIALYMLLSLIIMIIFFFRRIEFRFNPSKGMMSPWDAIVKISPVLAQIAYFSTDLISKDFKSTSELFKQELYGIKFGKGNTNAMRDYFVKAIIPNEVKENIKKIEKLQKYFKLLKDIIEFYKESARIVNARRMLKGGTKRKCKGKKGKRTSRFRLRCRFL
jgi:hypothetical protein